MLGYPKIIRYPDFLTYNIKIKSGSTNLYAFGHYNSEIAQIQVVDFFYFLQYICI